MQNIWNIVFAFLQACKKNECNNMKISFIYSCMQIHVRYLTVAYFLAFNNLKFEIWGWIMYHDFEICFMGRVKKMFSLFILSNKPCLVLIKVIKLRFTPIRTNRMNPLNSKKYTYSKTNFININFKWNVKNRWCISILIEFWRNSLKTY